MIRVGLTGGMGSGKSAVALVFAEGGAHVFSADELGRALMQPGQPVYEAIVSSFGPGVVAANGHLDRRALAVQAFEHGRLAELNAIVHPAVLRAQAEAMCRVAEEDPGGIAVVESALIFEVSRGAEVSRSVSRSAEATPSAQVRSPTTEAVPETAKGFPKMAPETARRSLLHDTNSSDPTDDSPAGWSQRFDRLVLVTAPDELKISRYIARVAAPGANQATREVLARDARARLSAQIPDAEKAPYCDFVLENTGSLVILRRKAQAILAALKRG